MASSIQNILAQGLGGSASFSPPTVLDSMYASTSSMYNQTSPPFFVELQGWMHQHGGYFHPHQELKYDEKFNGWMLFATEDIETGQVLSKVPWELIISGSLTASLFSSNATADDLFEHITGLLNCESTNQLIHELALGDSSSFGPYIRYLREVPSFHIPAMWTPQGRGALTAMLGGMDAGDIPPVGPFDVIDIDWFGVCNGSEDGVEAAALLLQQGLWNTLVVPTFDWYTHRNGDHLNAKVNVVPGQFMEITAVRPIVKGEALHRSFDLCELCHPDEDEGTPDLFRDFGIVESYPQRWTFKPNAVLLENDRVGQHVYEPEFLSFVLTQNTTNGAIHVQWDKSILFDDGGRNYIRRIFRQHLRKLYRFQKIQHDLEDPDSTIPEKERIKILDYFHSLRTALQYAVYSLKNEGDGTGTECHENMSSNEGACEASHIDIYGWHYDDLKWEDDDINYIYPTCSTTQLLDFHVYDKVDDLQSSYQKLWFVNREEDNDVCLNLENTLQICASYRPHYHEFFVHFPARFLEKVERVIFIGGGDSMLLHEVLKYPTLQKVVGLELDQQVTRKSFEHFQSQPHWDDDRVEWWYGDATKSLPLLPRDYWGSFDLVLVDLSETVMSFSVTKTMDIFSALSLLLKPEGIMIKNEPYLDQFSAFFDYSIHIFYGTPKICTQVLVMGSNQVDFLHHPTKDHGIERLLLEPLDDDERLRYKYMHDYRKTDAREQGKCDTEENLIEHGARAGLIEILEAEQVSMNFENDNLENLIFQVAKNQGLNPLSAPMANDKEAAIIVLKEGYIMARPSAEHRYIAFDIHLWGAFTKMEAMRSALLQAVGAKRSSFYRVVAGGMHGTSTWKEDQETIGIRVAHSRNCDQKVSVQSTIDEAKQLALKESLHQSIRFLPSKEKITAFVLCGLETNDEHFKCSSGDFLTTAAANIQVRVFRTCMGLQNQGASFDNIDDMYDCEMKMIEAMTAFVENMDEDIDMIIIDQSAPRTMGQILNSILAVKNNREALLADQNILLALSPMLDGESWRKNALERYRKATHFFPVSTAEVILSSVSQDLRLDVAVVNDRYFFQHLKELELSLQSALSTFDKIEARRITGGMLYFDHEYDGREFPREAYDAQPTLQQLVEQVPLGRQGIFQYEYVEVAGGDSSAAAMLSFESLNGALQETIQTVLGIADASIRRWSTFLEVGDGVAIVTIFPNGSAVLVWDGRRHVDINLYTKDQTKATADQFVDSFARVTRLTKTLRDDQPRGPGRVVLFEHELRTAGTRYNATSNNTGGREE